MKKIVLVLSVILLVGCSSQIERDVNSMAERVVEFKQVQERMKDYSNLRGKRMTRQEYELYARDYIEYSSKMLDKYSETPEQRKEFYRLVEERVKELNRE
ncbi:MAG: hypothetical protein IJ436_04295 [Bacteroidaceae bacterium]|nr:hypothetical protein [Bacteroidaceae bacterium]